jgi:hypothetical protein
MKIGKEEERAMFQQMQTMAQKQVNKYYKFCEMLLCFINFFSLITLKYNMLSF